MNDVSPMHHTLTPGERASRPTRLRVRLSRGWSLLAGLLICGAVHAVEAPVASASDAAADTGAPNIAACTHVAPVTTFPEPKDTKAVPRLQGRITDTTGALTDACRTDLNARLAELERRTGVQLAVLLVATSGQATIEQFATAVFEKWKLGHAKTDNGLLLVAALNDHHVRIEVGYGLEGAVPDIAAAEIIRQQIVPAFRARNFEAGLSGAVDALVERLQPRALETAVGEAKPAVTASEPERPRDVARAPEQKIDVGMWVLLVLANVVFGIAAMWRKARWYVYVGGSYIGTAVALIARLPAGLIDTGVPAINLFGALVLPAFLGLPACLLGMGLFRSASVRKFMAIVVGVLLALIAAGHAMGFSAGQVLMTVGLALLVVLGVAATLADFFNDWESRPSSGSSAWGSSGNSDSGSSWSADSSSSDSFSGDGGSSGGGGASDSW
ncbi:TPM domain-containing protein [Burkholderia pyrrocinia]|nr:TPM domain-containing protein [Burkholderia pyrrocinia]NTX26673.1 TPM domain-containing protein [Burkholderia pyrrocinia]